MQKERLKMRLLLSLQKKVEAPESTMPATVFYDVVAKDYNQHMTVNDRKAREIISARFTSIVNSGNVLDFGGGTGLDMPWLVNNGHYRVFFLETSFGMREIARKSLLQMEHSKAVFFVDDRLDFNEWGINNLPFGEKMDGVLANFAVLNSIPNLEVFFEKMALVCNKNCHLFLTVLRTGFPGILKKYPLKSAARLLLQGQLVVTNKYDGVEHATYIHSIGALRSASARQFNYVSQGGVPFSDFVLLHLSKK